MRFAMLIVALTAIAVAFVQVERAEVRANHEIRQYQAQQISLHRELGNQQLNLSELTSPSRVRQAASALALGLSERTYISGAAPAGSASHTPARRVEVGMAQAPSHGRHEMDLSPSR